MLILYLLRFFLFHESTFAGVIIFTKTMTQKYTGSSTRNDVNWWRSPTESPDLNPIEKVWGSMKTYLWDKVKPKNLVELKTGIKVYWKSLTPETCSRYVNHSQKVMPGVIQEKEGPSGH